MQLKPKSTSACIADLAARIGRDMSAKSVVAKFLNISTDHLQRLLIARNNPMGPTLIRLRFYLEFIGYKVQEVESLDPVLRDTGRLYAFNVVTMEDMIAEIGRQPNDSARSSMMGALAGRIGFSDERKRKLARLVRAKTAFLHTKMLATKKVFDPTAASATPTLAVTPASQRADRLLRDIVSINEINADTAMAQTCAGFLKAIVPLLEHVLSDKFTPENRESIRQLAGERNVSRLSHLLTMLSNETARSALNQN